MKFRYKNYGQGVLRPVIPLYKNIRVGFLEDIGKYAYGVVGQKGFFDIFVVKFDLLKKEIELKPRG